MKKLLVLLLTLCLLTPALAEGGFVYSSTSVTTCEQTQKIYDPFYQSGELSVLIPGLKEKLVPQGMAYDAQENCLVFTSYRSDKENSALIAVDLATGEIVKEVFLLNIDGSKYVGHAGGVCVTEKNIYLSNASKLFRISLDTYRALPASGPCAFEEAIPVPVNSSYCACADGVLWVGEFQYGTKYKTDSSHKVKTADGRYKAWTCGYVLDETTENEFKPSALSAGGDAIPDYVFSMTERIQGITFTDEFVYLSQSYGRTAHSMIHRYRYDLAAQPQAMGEVSGQQVPIWFLDSDALDKTLVCPPMTEGLCTIDSDIYVLFESAAETYMNPKKPSSNPMDRVFKLTDF